MRVPRIVPQPFPRLDLVPRHDDQEAAALLVQRAAELDEPSATRPSMNAACSSHQGCSRASLARSRCEPAVEYAKNRTGRPCGVAMCPSFYSPDV